MELRQTHLQNPRIKPAPNPNHILDDNEHPPPKPAGDQNPTGPPKPEQDSDSGRRLRARRGPDGGAGGQWRQRGQLAARGQWSARWWMGGRDRVGRVIYLGFPIVCWAGLHLVLGLQCKLWSPVGHPRGI